MLNIPFPCADTVHIAEIRVLASLYISALQNKHLFWFCSPSLFHCELRCNIMYGNLLDSLLLANLAVSKSCSPFCGLWSLPRQRRFNLVGIHHTKCYLTLLWNTVKRGDLSWRGSISHRPQPHHTLVRGQPPKSRMALGMSFPALWAPRSVAEPSDCMCWSPGLQQHRHPAVYLEPFGWLCRIPPFDPTDSSLSPWATRLSAESCTWASRVISVFKWWRPSLAINLWDVYSFIQERICVRGKNVQGLDPTVRDLI